MIRRDDLKVGMKVRGIFTSPDTGKELSYVGTIYHVDKEIARVKFNTISWTGKESYNHRVFDIRYDGVKGCWGANYYYGELFILNDKMQKLKERLMSQ